MKYHYTQKSYRYLDFVIDPDELTHVFIIYIADMNICYRGQMIIFGSLT